MDDQTSDGVGLWGTNKLSQVHNMAVLLQMNTRTSRVRGTKAKFVQTRTQLNATRLAEPSFEDMTIANEATSWPPETDLWLDIEVSIRINPDTHVRPSVCLSVWFNRSLLFDFN